MPDPGNPQDLNRYSYVRNNPLVYADPSGHCGPVCWTILALTVGYTAYDYLSHPDIAKAPSPYETILDNPPRPTDLPENDEAICLYCDDLQNGKFGAAAVGIAIEATPLDEIPGVKPIMRGAGDAVVQAMYDFGWKGEFVKKFFPKHKTFGKRIWGGLAEKADDEITDRQLFAYYNEAGEITGAMKIHDKAHSSGALYIYLLEGLGDGAGTSLFKQAVLESQRYYNGGIVLDSSKEAYGWYMRFNPTRVEGSTFYWSPEDAAKVLE